MTVRVQTEDFDLSAEVAQLRSGTPKVGAVVTFVGTVRDLNEGEHVAEMELEHYPGMTEKALEEIVAEAKARWDLFDALVIHRVGPLKPLEQHHRFGREGGEGGQATKKTGDGQQSPGRRQIGPVMEDSDDDANQVTANEVGRQRAKRQRLDARIEPQRQAPAQPGAQRRAQCDGSEAQRDRGAHLAIASSSVTRASTQRAPEGVCSFFQNGALVFR